VRGGPGPPSGPDVVGAIERPATLEKRERALMKIAGRRKGREPAPAVSHGFKTLMKPSSFQARAQGRIVSDPSHTGIGGVPGAYEGGWSFHSPPVPPAAHGKRGGEFGEQIARASGLSGGIPRGACRAASVTSSLQEPSTGAVPSCFRLRQLDLRRRW